MLPGILNYKHIDYKQSSALGSASDLFQFLEGREEKQILKLLEHKG